MPHLSDSAASFKKELPSVALVVDDEVHILEEIRAWLANAGWACVCVRTVSEALEASRDPTLTLGLIDYRLKNGDDGLRLGRALWLRRGLPFILFSGYLNVELAVQAMKAGASNALEKPLTEDRLYNAVEVARTARERFAGHPPPANSAFSTEASPIHELAPSVIRWSRMILRTCTAPNDPYKVALWVEHLTVSERFAREICGLCQVTPNNSCDLARFLRAIARSKATSSPLEIQFTVGDERTLNSLFVKAGLDRKARTVNLRDFFRRQAFVETTRPCLRELAHLAANSRLLS